MAHISFNKDDPQSTIVLNTDITCISNNNTYTAAIITFESNDSEWVNKIATAKSNTSVYLNLKYTNLSVSPTIGNYSISTGLDLLEEETTGGKKYVCYPTDDNIKDGIVGFNIEYIQSTATTKVTLMTTVYFLGNMDSLKIQLDSKLIDLIEPADTQVVSLQIAHCWCKYTFIALEDLSKVRLKCTGINASGGNDTYYFEDSNVYNEISKDSTITNSINVNDMFTLLQPINDNVYTIQFEIEVGNFLYSYNWVEFILSDGNKMNLLY